MARLNNRAFLALVGRRYAFEATPWLPVPANVTVPIEQQEAVPSRIDEGAAIAVAAGDLTTAVVHPVKIATIRILNKELARLSD